MLEKVTSQIGNTNFCAEKEFPELGMCLFITSLWRRNWAPMTNAIKSNYLKSHPTLPGEGPRLGAKRRGRMEEWKNVGSNTAIP
ncbi:MAG: hypothetical protein PF450_05830 [Bacteroidales bacterium]|jgi:hypothetical protein|nr:hypothetical protein [Bacteroidales bacterium]